MLKKWNRILAFMLSIALVITTFGSDFASAKAYAEEGTDETITVEEQAPAETQTETEAGSETTEPTTEETTPPVVEDEPKVVPEVIPEVVPEEEKNPEEVPEVVEPTEEEPAEDEDEVSDEDAEEAEEDEEASEEATEEKNVTVTYTADKGGYVSEKSETINVNDKDAVFKGSTATAWNDKYEFTEWVDADGIQVCTEPTFTPAGLTEDATFTAKFVAVDNIEELMPKVSGSLSSSTLEVTVSAEAGIFPAGTTVTITEIGDDQALATAKEAIPAATSAKGVDITFHDVDGNEIQPANSKYVNVSMTLKAALEGDNFAVVHDHGDVETIGASISQDAEGNATEATFTSNEFSVFIVAGTDNDDEILRKVEHYTFEVKNSSDVWETVSEQDITSGDELACPEIPSLTKNQVFQGWYFWDTDANDFGEPVEFGVKSDVTNDAKYTVRAKVQTTYYVTFIGAEGEVVAVEAVTADSSEDEAPLKLTVSVQPKEDTQNFTGWTNLNNEYCKDGATIDASNDKNRTLTAFIEKGYWVHFDENDGGDGGGASYTRPEFVVEGGKATRPANPTRNGYVFRGWYADKNCTEEFEFTTTTITKTTYIYAKWAKGTAPFTVIIWKQNVDTDKNAAFDPKNYDYDSQTVIEGHATDDLIKDSWLGNALNKNFTGFNATPKKVITNDGKISAKGDTVVNVYYDRKLITYKFYTADYYGRDGSTRYVWNAKEYTSLKEMSGLYGQPISKYDGYRWPSEREWWEYKRSTYYYGEEIEILGQGMTFLAHFSTDGDKDFYSYEDAGGSLKVRHYKQNKDGSSYPTEATDSTNIRKADGGNTWYFSNKYDGFTVKSYRIGDTGSYQEVPGGNEPHKDFNKNLYIRYERNKYKLTLMSVAASIDPETQNVIAENTAQTVQEYKDILFESSLASYETKAINDAKKVKTPPIPGYVPKLAADGETIGLWKDEAGTEPFDFNTTMPATNDTRVYIVWVKPKYKVYFDLNVDGDKDMDTTTGYNTVETNGQPTTLDLYYGDKVVRDTVMTKFVRSGYDLVGWFVKETDKTYDYGAVTSDVNLYAKWRKQGGTKIKYEENGTYIKNKDTGARENVAGTMLDTNRDTHTYATDSTVVVTAGSTAEDPDEFTFIGWELLDKNRNVVKAYYPNDHFDLDDSYIVTEVGEDGEKENYVVLRALYAKTGGGTAADTTTLTYNINDGSDSPKTVTISKNGDHDLRVNEKIQAWTLAEAEKNNFKREGFELLGWNIDQNEANEGTFKIALGEKYIIANNKNTDDNPSTNVLYAVWKELNGSYTVEYYKSFPESPDEKIGEPVTVEGVKAGTKITAADIDVDKYRETAGVGYKAGVVVPESTTIEAGKNKTIKVVYKPVKATITVEGNYYSTTYNGQKQSVSFPKDATNDDPGFKVTSIEYDAKDVSGIISKDDVSIKQSIGASGTEVGKYPFNLKPEDFVLDNDDILDYEFKIAKDSEGKNKDGIFEILPVGKVKVVITGKTDKLPYNGKEQSVTGFEFTSNNDLFTAASFTYKGKTGDEAQAAAIAKGTDVNDEGYAMGLDEEDFAVVNETTFPDVEFEVRDDGLLTITPRTVNITVAGKKETKTFNGEEQSVTGFETYEVEVVKVEGAETPEFSTADVIFDFDGDGTADEEDDAEATGLTPDTYPMGLKKAMFTLDPEDMNFVLGTVDVTDGELVIENGNGEIEIAFSVTDVTKPYTGYMQTVEALATVVGPKEPLYKKVLDAISDALTITAGAADDQTTFEFKNKTYVVKNIKVKAEGRNVTEGSAGIPPYDFKLEKDIVITLDEVDVTKSFTVNEEGLKGKFNITPVDLTYTADDKSKVQGTADPALTAQLTGLIGEDVARKADVEAFLKEITEIYRDKGEDVGTYVIHIDPKSFEPQEPIRPMVKALADDAVVVDDTEGIDFESMTLITNNYNEPKLVNGLFTITAAPGPNPPTPTPPTPTPTPDTPAPVAAPAVLGAQREVEVDGPAVLGARRGRTADDTATGTARIFAIIVSAAVAIALLFKGKKKEED